MNFNLKILLNSIIFILVLPLAGHCINDRPTEDNHRITKLLNNFFRSLKPKCLTTERDDEDEIYNLGIDKLNFESVESLDETTSTENSWSKTRHDQGINILPNEFTLHRQARQLVTDICTANKFYDSGIHIWRIKWPRSTNKNHPVKLRRGTHASIGIVTPEVNTFSARGYIHLLGSTDLSSHSFAWDFINNEILHNGEKIKNYPDNEEKYTASEDIAVILNMAHGALSFYDIEKDVYLGDAVTGLKGKWAPAINCVRGNALINLIYCGLFEKKPLSLQQLCKHSINKNQKNRSNNKKLDFEELPKFLQRYLTKKEPSLLYDTDKEIHSTPI